MSGTRIYSAWRNMKGRCKHCNRYADIVVCEEWDSSFELFCSWALANGYEDNLTLDRKDNNLGYNPENCRWISNQEQQNNKKDTLYITIDEITDTIDGWCKRTGLKRTTLRCRYYQTGLRGEELIDLKPRKRGKGSDRYGK